MRNLQRYLDAGYDGEILHVKVLRIYIQLRTALRRPSAECKDWYSDPSREAVRALRKIWELYRRGFRWRYVRSVRELKYALLGWLTISPGSDAWLRFFLHRLHV